MRGIPWTFSGNAGLYGRPEVRLLIAFLRSVAHPDDSVSLHYLASSDVYQVPIVDLTKCATRSEEHTSELQSHLNLVCRLLLEKKKQKQSLQPYLFYCTSFVRVATCT